MGEIGDNLKRYFNSHGLQVTWMHLVEGFVSFIKKVFGRVKNNAFFKDDNQKGSGQRVSKTYEVSNL